MLAVSLTMGCGETDSAEKESGPRPKQATLSVAGFAQTGQAIRLADGTLGAQDGDVALALAVQLSLKSPVDADEMFCLQGTFAALADVPTDDQSCPGSAANRWEGRLFLSGVEFHTNEESPSIGLSALVRNAARDTLYRLRILGDTAGPGEDGGVGIATATFEYEPVPAN